MQRASDSTRVNPCLYGLFAHLLFWQDCATNRCARLLALSHGGVRNLRKTSIPQGSAIGQSPRATGAIRSRRERQSA